MIVEQEFLQVEEGSADVLKEKKETAIPPGFEGFGGGWLVLRYCTAPLNSRQQQQ